VRLVREDEDKSYLHAGMQDTLLTVCDEEGQCSIREVILIVLKPLEVELDWSGVNGTPNAGYSFF